MSNTTDIKPAVGHNILTKANPYKITSMTGRGSKRKALCGHTQYFTSNLTLVSKGGTKKYPNPTWRYSRKSK